MPLILHPSYSSILKKLLLSIIFLIFLFPYSINLSGSGVSANYSFIFFPILIILLTGNIKIPNNNIIFIILLFCFIFFISVLYQFEFYKYFNRRLISFIIFMSVFSYLFISITDNMVKAFKISIVLISVGYCLYQLVDFFIIDGIFSQNHTGNNKARVGSQRFGFVFILAFWILALYEPRHISINILKAVLILIITLGLMNTYSRSSILALLGSMIIFIYTKIDLKAELFNFHSFLKFVKYLFVFLFSIFLLWNILPNHISFYTTHLLYFFVEGNFYNEIINSNPADSLGYRSVMLKEIFNFVADNPFTGSGFLGCWVMFESLDCSAHNQYADVLFRTGLFGFFIYIYLLFRVLKYLRTTNRDLFFGLVGILIYGIVHETFKLSHGGFILAFLVSMTFEKNITFYYLTIKSKMFKKLIKH